MLALILVHTLYLAVKNAVRVDHLAGGALQVVGKIHLILGFDLFQTLQNSGVAAEFFQLFQVGGILAVIRADHIVQQAAQIGVAGQQPAAIGNAVGHIFESLGLIQVIVMEHALLNDLAVQLGNAVDAVAGVGTDIGHTDLVVTDHGHIVDLAVVAGECLFQLDAGAAIHLLHDHENAGQGHAEQVHIPLFQSLAHHGVVGVGKHLAADIKRFIPAEAAFIQQHTHHFGNGQRGVGIVQLNGNFVGQVFQRAVLAQVLFQNITDRSSRQEILLAQAQDLALNMVVVGVQDLRDQLGAGRFVHGIGVFTGVEAVHVKIGGLCLPQTQLGNALSAVALHIHIVGHSLHSIVIDVLHMVEAIVPGFLDLAVKTHFNGLIGVCLQPYAAARQPVVSGFLLPTVHDLLLEDAVLIQNRMAGACNAGGGHAVQIAGGQTAKAAVAKACIGLLLIHGIQADACILQHVGSHFVQAQIKQAGFQAAAHQKFHAQVVNLFVTCAQCARKKNLVIVAHDLADHHGHGTVNLFQAGFAQFGAALAFQGGAQQLIKLFFGVFLHGMILAFNLVIKANGRLPRCCRAGPKLR